MRRALKEFSTVRPNGAFSAATDELETMTFPLLPW
jgi:hypothetical protein